MRSSKSRSRGNKNRNNRPSGGNIINRVFDSSGPDGKVRGTPQQIIEKYNQLHRDAQLAGDRVNAENFAQHAEHYTRMLAEAMREVERAREEQEQAHRDRQADRDRERDRERETSRERERHNRYSRFNSDVIQGDEPAPEPASEAVFAEEPSLAVSETTVYSEPMPVLDLSEEVDHVVDFVAPLAAEPEAEDSAPRKLSLRKPRPKSEERSAEKFDDRPQRRPRGPRKEVLQPAAEGEAQSRKPRRPRKVEETTE